MGRIDTPDGDALRSDYHAQPRRATDPATVIGAMFEVAELLKRADTILDLVMVNRPGMPQGVLDEVTAVDAAIQLAGIHRAITRAADRWKAALDAKASA